MGIFDGRGFAKKIEEGLPKDTGKKLAVIVDSENFAGMKYVEAKRKVGERLGIEFEIQNSNDKAQLKLKIQSWNKDDKVGGIMIQMPYPNSQSLIDLIDPSKDVDGLREDSPFLPAAVRAVVEILRHSFNSFKDTPCKRARSILEVAVVGDKGMVGSRLLRALPARLSMLALRVVGMDKEDFDPEMIKKADVVISATGQAGLIKPEMVKRGVIAIDVGFPVGDFDLGVAQRAAFFTPVPGGVGPVTVVMLFKNLIGG
jgi:methylenetetrahydrofolate dehydrogenase (NADP+)/methenyltetrahydrofolate cyclohydrolase